MLSGLDQEQRYQDAKQATFLLVAQIHRLFVGKSPTSSMVLLPTKGRGIASQLSDACTMFVIAQRADSPG